MPLKIYNTLSKTKEEFKPLHPPRVNMYVCGITVYDYCHLGHARAAVVFDIIFRYLKFKGYQVEYVRNFTDIDDKIIKRSQENNQDWRELTAHFIQAFHEDMAALGNQSPGQEPKATEYIEAMQKMIQNLIDNGVAYQGGRDVFYAVRKFSTYGKLANKNIEELEVGARVDVQEEKEDPLDFALWKGAKPGEPKWSSPWGEGRPGWHIECSAMSTQLLGDTLDIHGGGRDLTFPHHENERAQSEGATGKPFVRFWIHNGFVNLNADKMSKSTGNFLTIREILKRYSFEAIRYFLLSAHYRSPLDFTDQNIQDAVASVDRIYETLKRVKDYRPSVSDSRRGVHDQKLIQMLENFPSQFEEAMDDDFNTAQALGRLFDLVREINKFLDKEPGSDLWEGIFPSIQQNIRIVSDNFGLFGQGPDAYWESKKDFALSDLAWEAKDIEAKIQERREARANKDFARADEIRDELAQGGVILKDNPDGTTTWTVK